MDSVLRTWPRMRGQVRSTESIDHHLEERGRDSEVVRRAPGPAQSALYRRERLRIIIIPAHVLEQGQKMMKGRLAVDPARPFYAFRHALVQTGQAPLREGDADYRDLKGAALHHRIKRRKDHLVGEIARHPEEHQRVRMGGFHQSSPSLGRGLFRTVTERWANARPGLYTPEISSSISPKSGLRSSISRFS